LLVLWLLTFLRLVGLVGLIFEGVGLVDFRVDWWLFEVREGWWWWLYPSMSFSLLGAQKKKCMFNPNP
jgi:hypothetical protein